MTTEILTKNQFELLLEFSKEKNIKISEDTKEIYEKLSEGLNEKQKQFLEDFYKFVIEERDKIAEIIRRQEEYKVGWFVKDFYFIVGLKTLLPLVYKNFFLKGITGKQLEEQFSAKLINELIEEKNNLQFCRSFYDNYIDYLQKIKEKDIELLKQIIFSGKKAKNIKDRTSDYVFTNYNEIEFRKWLKNIYPNALRGISRSLLVRVLKKMRNYSKIMHNLNPSI
jgi:hypothetical protein